MHKAMYEMQSRAVSKLMSKYVCAVLAFAVGIVSLGLLPSVVHASTPTGRFGLAQIYHLRWASDAQVSPNGKWIAFVQNAYDIMHNDQHSSVWLIRSNGSNLHQVSKPNMNGSSPTWSPHGERLLYVLSKRNQQSKKSTETDNKSSKNGKRWEITVRRMGAGGTSQLATLKHKPTELAWSPKGGRIAFAMFTPAERGSIANMPPKPEGAHWKAPVTVKYRLDYRWNGKGYLPYGYNHLFVVSATGGRPKQLTFGRVNDTAGLFGRSGGLVWSRSGKDLIFSANRSRDAAYHPDQSNIYQLSVAGGQPRALTHGRGPHSAPRISPDGAKIAYVGYENPGPGFHKVTHLYVMNRDGSNAHPVMTHFARDVSNPRWSANGKRLYFQYMDDGVAKLAYVTVADGQVNTLATIPGEFGVAVPYSGGQYSLAPRAHVFAFVLSTATHPGDVAVGRRVGGKAQTTRLTHLNQKLLGRDELGSLEAIHFQSSYKHHPVEGWILKPPGFDSEHKYPLVLQIHGGPSLSYGPMFSAEDQIYAALGYVVLYVNPCGSTSYGPQFANLINGDYPGKCWNDLMSGVNAVIKRGYVNTQRLYVTGGSGGGVLTTWTVGHTNRFRAAVAVKPVTNWYSWVLTADMGYTGMKFWMEGLPWNNLQHYMQRSPISYVGHVKTPTMVIHGLVDYRTPAPSSIQFYRGLKMRHVPTALVRIPGASHEISAKPRNLAAKIAYITGWFACYGGQSVGHHVCPYPDNKGSGANK